MRVVDSGVAIAAFATWHEAHEPGLAETRARATYQRIGCRVDYLGR